MKLYGQLSRRQVVGQIYGVGVRYKQLLNRWMYGNPVTRRLSTKAVCSYIAALWVNVLNCRCPLARWELRGVRCLLWAGFSGGVLV